MRTAHKGFWLAAAAWSAFGTTALAQEAQTSGAATETTEAPITVTGERRAYRTDVSTAAMKTETPLLDTPQSVSIVTRDLIEDQGMRSMADVVRYVPGVSMGQGEGHRDAPTLRGNASTADLFVDGVRDDVQYYRDLYNAERIEVLKGPNAMIFGRGGGGGVINRVTKQADWAERREIALTGGSWDQRRGAIDFGQGLSDLLALRLTGVYENSDSYRDFVNIERYGANPTAAFALSEDTRLRVGYEYFSDYRTVDRGVPSQNGRPVGVDASTFFGNPDLSWAEAQVNLGSVLLEHRFSDNLRLRNRTLYGDYDKFYQNVFANSAVNGAGNVTLGAYHSGTQRQNLFNQTDLIWRTSTGVIDHTILIGAEFGRQETDNFRNNSAFAEVVNITTPISFSPVAFDLPNQDNSVEVTVAAGYVQDQITLSKHWQIIAGVRFDRFEIGFDNFIPNPDQSFSRSDDLVSPRAGLIFKPHENISLYASYAVSHLPSSGDQFASLDATAAAFEPEEFENAELGIKWNILPSLTLTTAIYRLDRTNTRAPGPTPGSIVLTGSQRSEGFELELSGAVTDQWEIIAGYANQDAEITTTTSAAPAGRRVPLVPEQTFSLWNAYRFSAQWGAGLGVIHQTEIFASITNNVILPDYTRVDAALFLTLNEHVEAQLNVENVFDEDYWPTAHNDNNITPGSPRALRIGLSTRF